MFPYLQIFLSEGLAAYERGKNMFAAGTGSGMRTVKVCRSSTGQYAIPDISPNLRIGTLWFAEEIYEVKELRTGAAVASAGELFSGYRAAQYLCRSPTR